MRFMMIVKASSESETGAIPSEQDLNEMGKYNEELVKAGVLLDANGLLESARGARVQFTGKNQTTVVDGPFTETKELVAGYWIIDVKSKDEAIEWARRIPFQEGEVEVRKVAEAEDFGESYTPEIKEAEDKLREQLAERQQS
ncbi:YciI family protein [Prauserella cavernicola]|uniref:YciI family protein n=1 Tax=Prauserella cavernicola TaxID=2800127 RepID=A0A934V2K7_9PSEU|nr:YciI family protein [Prauserella cavernicola]MBK1783072.1 YciI family protein [Prauserella cavernicola]